MQGFKNKDEEIIYCNKQQLNEFVQNNNLFIIGNKEDEDPQEILTKGVLNNHHLEKHNEFIIKKQNGNVKIYIKIFGRFFNDIYSLNAYRTDIT